MLLEPGSKQRGFSVGDDGEPTRSRGLDGDLETRVLQAQEDFVAVETEFGDVDRVLPVGSVVVAG